jgi:hypothetical protein
MLVSEQKLVFGTLIGMIPVTIFLMVMTPRNKKVKARNRELIIRASKHFWDLMSALKSSHPVVIN